MQGALPGWLAGLILGRDALLVAGAFVHRYRALGWRARGWAEFFRISPAHPGDPSPAHTPGGAPNAQSVSGDARNMRDLAGGAAGGAEPASAAGAFVAPPAPFVRPLLVSKANTVLQLGLIAGCVARSWYGWPPEPALWALGAATGATTVASCAAYVRAYLNGTLLK